MSKTKKQTPDETAATGSPGSSATGSPGAGGIRVSRRRLLGTAGAAGATGLVLG
ncbi:deferrochelatase/peroxidase EfeB, partial [Streptomyces sp. McG3]|nr:deferrochelatase/peroxidase EfeB [Streptomyces sp. McG3]